MSTMATTPEDRVRNHIVEDMTPSNDPKVRVGHRASRELGEKRAWFVRAVFESSYRAAIGRLPDDRAGRGHD